MNQHQAARALGISVRTLQRLVQNGKLKVDYVPGKTRRVPVFDEVEVKQLRALQAPKPLYPQARCRGGKTRKEPLGFRVSAEERARLAEEGARLGMSGAEYALRLVQMGLETAFHGQATTLKSEIPAIKQQMSCLHEEIQKLQIALTESIEVVLEVAGLSPMESRRWTDANLNWSSSDQAMSRSVQRNE